MTAKTVIRSFLETTSIKGVSKAAKSNVSFLRISWTVCILFGLGMTVFLLCNTIMEYYRYEYNTNFIEQRISPPFPDITICKINPIFFTGKDAHDYHRYKDILEQHYNDTTENNTNIQDFIMDLTGRVGYFQYSDSKHILKKFNSSFVVHCDLGLWTGQKKPCGHHITQSPLFLQPDIPLCVQMTLNATERNTIRSLETVLFLDDNRCNEDADLSIKNLLSVGGDGVFVLPHGTSVEPAKYDGIRIPPGVEVDVLLKAHSFERLGNPYSNCSKNTNISDEVCLLACEQQMVLRQCKCLHPFLPTTKAQRLKNPFCGNVSADHVTFEERVACLHNKSTFTRQEELCTDKCFPPCEEITYDLTQAYSHWPHETFKTVLSGFVKNQKTIPKGVLKEIYCSIKHDKDAEFLGESFNSDSGTKDVKFNCTHPQNTNCSKSSSADPIYRNFLKINIILTKRALEVSQDTPKVSLNQVYGTVGGTLNLWIGITFVTLIELCELLYNLIKDKFDADKVKDVDNEMKKEVPK